MIPSPSSLPEDPSSECAVCLQTFDTQTHKPCISNCGHTLCERCIQSLLNTPCPNRCGNTISTHNTNYFAMQLLEEAERNTLKIKSLEQGHQQNRVQAEELRAQIARINLQAQMSDRLLEISVGKEKEAQQRITQLTLEFQSASAQEREVAQREIERIQAESEQHQANIQNLQTQKSALEKRLQYSKRVLLQRLADTTQKHAAATTESHRFQQERNIALHTAYLQQRQRQQTEAEIQRLQTSNYRWRLATAGVAAAGLFTTAAAWWWNSQPSSHLSTPSPASLLNTTDFFDTVTANATALAPVAEQALGNVSSNLSSIGSAIANNTTTVVPLAVHAIGQGLHQAYQAFFNPSTQCHPDIQQQVCSAEAKWPQGSITQEQYMQQLMAPIRSCQYDIGQGTPILEPDARITHANILDANCFYKGEYPPLTLAVRAQDVEAVRHLLTVDHANPNLIDLKTKKTALMNLRGNNASKIADLLLKAGAFVDLTDANGDTALMHAVYNLQTEVVQKLLNKKASVHIRNHKGLDAGDLINEKSLEFNQSGRQRTQTNQQNFLESTSLLKIRGFLKIAYQKQGLTIPPLPEN